MGDGVERRAEGPSPRPRVAPRGSARDQPIEGDSDEVCRPGNSFQLLWHAFQFADSPVRGASRSVPAACPHSWPAARGVGRWCPGARGRAGGFGGLGCPAPPARGGASLTSSFLCLTAGLFSVAAVFKAAPAHKGTVVTSCQQKKKTGKRGGRDPNCNSKWGLKFYTPPARPSHQTGLANPIAENSIR